MDIALSIPIETAPACLLCSRNGSCVSTEFEKEKKGKEFLRGYAGIKALLSRIDQVKMR